MSHALRPAGVRHSWQNAFGLALAAGAAILVGAALGSGVSAVWLFASALISALAVVGIWRIEPLLIATAVVFLMASSGLATAIPNVGDLRWVLLSSVVGLVAVKAGVRGASSARQGPLASLSLFWLVGAATLSTMWSVAPSLTLGRSISFAALIGLLILLPRSGISPNQVLATFRWLAVSLSILNTVAFLANVRAVSGRYAGVFLNPNTLGVANALLFPCLVWGAMAARTTTRRLLFVACATASILQLLLAGGRGGVLAMVAGYLYLLFTAPSTRLSGRRRFYVVVPAVFALAVAQLAVDPHAVSRTDTRSQFFGPFQSLFAEAPFHGHGFGASVETLRPFARAAGYAPGELVEFHNSYLNILNDLGLMGGLIVAIVVALSFIRRREKPSVYGAILVAGLVSAATESWLFSVGSGFPLVFWFAVVELSRPNRVGSPPHLQGSAVRPSSRKPLSLSSRRTSSSTAGSS